MFFKGHSTWSLCSCSSSFSDWIHWRAFKPSHASGASATRPAGSPEAPTFSMHGDQLVLSYVSSHLTYRGSKASEACHVPFLVASWLKDVDILLNNKELCDVIYSYWGKITRAMCPNDARKQASWPTGTENLADAGPKTMEPPRNAAKELGHISGIHLQEAFAAS